MPRTSIALVLLCILSTACAGAQKLSDEEYDKALTRNPDLKPHTVESLDDPTPVSYDEYLGYFLNKPTDVLRKEAGRPTTITTEGPLSVWTYKRGAPEAYVYDPRTKLTTLRSDQFWCNTIFYVRGDEVESFRTEGNYCGKAGADEIAAEKAGKKQGKKD